MQTKIFKPIYSIYIAGKEKNNIFLASARKRQAFMLLLSSADFFFINLFKKSYRGTISVSVDDKSCR